MLLIIYLKDKEQVNIKGLIVKNHILILVILILCGCEDNNLTLQTTKKIEQAQKSKEQIEQAQKSKEQIEQAQSKRPVIPLSL